MNICKLQALGVTIELAKKAVDNKPECPATVYFMMETGLYYCEGKRRNAMVYCEAVSTWRVSSRYNHEVIDGECFIPMHLLAEAITS